MMVMLKLTFEITVYEIIFEFCRINRRKGTKEVKVGCLVSVSREKEKGNLNRSPHEGKFMCMFIHFHFTPGLSQTVKNHQAIKPSSHQTKNPCPSYIVPVKVQAECIFVLFWTAFPPFIIIIIIITTIPFHSTAASQLE